MAGAARGHTVVFVDADAVGPTYDSSLLAGGSGLRADCNANWLDDALEMGPLEGHALLFNGVDEYVDLGSPPDLSDLGQGDFTLEAWVRTTDPGILIGNYDGTPHWNLQIHESAPAGRVRFSFADGTTLDDHYTNVSITDGAWHHLAAVRTLGPTGRAKIYIDGGLVVDEPAASVGFSVPRSTMIGRDPQTGSSYLAGTLDEVRVWNIARDGVAIAADMYSALDGTEPGLVAYWRFEEGTGLTAADSAGTNDGTLVVPPAWIPIDPDCNTNLVPDECEVPGPTSLFATQALYGVGIYAVSMAADDLDGDGDLDLAVANWSDDNVSVLLNQGDGTFAGDVRYGAENYARSVAVGDLDGDGDLDLAVANAFCVSVLLRNDGDCNGNSVPDDCDLASGTSADCNTNNVPDECDIALPFDPVTGSYANDCNSNTIPDECEVAPIGVGPDCNTNLVPDECEPGSLEDCNANGTPDLCDIIAPGDFDADGDSGLYDYQGLADSMAGPGQTPGYPAPECLTPYLDAFDFDNDGDVDLYDFGRFQAAFSGTP